MRILAIQPYADGAGHYGKSTARLCQQFAKMGHGVTLCTNVDNTSRYLKEERGFRVITPLPPRPFFQTDQGRIQSPYRWAWGRIQSNLAVLRRSLSYLRGESVDVIQLFSYELFSTWLALRFRRPEKIPPMVIEIAAPNFSAEKYYGNQAERLWRRLQKLALKQMLGTYLKAATMNSASHIPELRKQLDLSDDFPVELVSDAREIPQTPIGKAEARKMIGLPGYPGCVFLFFGTIRRDRGLDNLIKSFGELSKEEECRLVIAGMPLDWNFTAETSWILQDPRVAAFISYVDEERLDAYFYAADALILPYRGYYTGSSGPLYEASARGLPIIASDVSEMGHIIRRHGNGMVVPPDDPGALAAALRKFMNLPSKDREMMGAHARAIVQTIDRAEVARTFVRVYETLLAEASTLKKETWMILDPKSRRQLDG